MVRRGRSSPRQQRGAASVVIAVLFLIMAGYAAVTALEMSASSVGDTTLDERGAQAYFLAESGIERGIQLFKSGTPCTDVGLSPGPYALGAGQFRVVGGTLEPPANTDCRITAEGQVGIAKRQISALVGPGNYVFIEHFPSRADYGRNWTESIVGGSRGDNRFNSANCSACAGTDPSSGSLHFFTRASGFNDRYIGYVQRSIPALSSQSGITVRVTLGYAKAAENNRADAQSIFVHLVSSATGNSATLWSHTAVSNAQTWVPVSQVVTLPAGEIYDRLRIEVALDEDGNRQVQVWIDEIHIEYP